MHVAGRREAGVEAARRLDRRAPQQHAARHPDHVQRTGLHAQRVGRTHDRAAVELGCAERERVALLVDEEAVRRQQADLVVALHQRHGPGKVGGIEPVVRAHELDHVGAGQLETAREVAEQPEVPLVAESLDPRVGEPGEDLLRIVG